MFESYEGSYSKKYQDHIPSSFDYKLVCVDDEFAKPIVVLRGKNGAYKFIEVIPKEYQYCKKVTKKHFNMNERAEEQFQSGNICWTCKKLIDDDNEKERDHCHVTGKFGGTIHWNSNKSSINSKSSCNIS